MAYMDFKTFVDFLKQLKKLRSGDFEVKREDYNIIFLTDDAVCGVVPKNDLVYSVLKALNLEEKEKPTIDYRPLDLLEPTARFDGQYLKFVLEIVKNYDAVDLTLKNDYPLKVETEDFVFYIAPRKKY